MCGRWGTVVRAVRPALFLHKQHTNPCHLHFLDKWRWYHLHALWMVETSTPSSCPGRQGQDRTSTPVHVVVGVLWLSPCRSLEAEESSCETGKSTRYFSLLYRKNAEWRITLALRHHQNPVVPLHQSRDNNVIRRAVSRDEGRTTLGSWGAVPPATSKQSTGGGNKECVHVGFSTIQLAV